MCTEHDQLVGQTWNNELQLYMRTPASLGSVALTAIMTTLKVMMLEFDSWSSSSASWLALANSYREMVVKFNKETEMDGDAERGC